MLSRCVHSAGWSPRAVRSQIQGQGEGKVVGQAIIRLPHHEDFPVKTA